MFYKKNKLLIFLALFIILAGLVVWGLLWRAGSCGKCLLTTNQTIKIGNSLIKVEVADTKAKQIQGLSDRASLEAGTGMLFDFNSSAYWAIWMKGMNFPIDVLWITDDLKISDIVENMSPESYPTSYKPHVPALYVLELPAGTVKSDAIAVGQAVTIQ